MYMKYLFYGFSSGVAAAFWAQWSGMTVATVIVLFLFVSQAAFWISLSAHTNGRFLARRLLGNLADSDYIIEPHRLISDVYNSKQDLTCLIVDDDPIFLGVMREMLTELGYRKIVTSHSGPDTLDKIAAADTPFDCCFLDIEMPEMDGVTLCGKIRSISGYEMTPLIMVTAMHGREHVRSAFAKGASDYITKPVQLSELSSRLSAIEVAAMRQNKADLDSRLVPIASLENYILQLERGGLYVATILTFKLTGHDHQLSNQSIQDPKKLLFAASSCIMTAIEDQDALLSYAGDGIFAAIFNRRTIDEAKIDRAIEIAERKHPEVTCPLYYRTISVGSQVQLSWEKEDGHSINILHEAIHATEETQQIFVA